MIVLDTNQLEAAQPPDGPILTLLRAIARKTGHELAIPEMALYEHMAHVRHDIESSYASLRSAKRKLLLPVPAWPGEISDLDVQLAVARRHDLMNRKTLLAHLPELLDGSRTQALTQALEQGLLDPAAPRNWSNPAQTQMVVGDGTVPKSPVKARSATSVDKKIGRVRRHRIDLGAGEHAEGGKEGTIV